MTSCSIVQMKTTQIFQSELYFIRKTKVKTLSIRAKGTTLRRKKPCQSLKVKYVLPYIIGTSVQTEDK